MLRIERAGKRLLAFRSLRQKPIHEFYDLTDFIVNSPEEFFGEIGESVFLLGTHANVGKPGGGSVDLLGVDASGASVAAVIEGSAEEPALSRAITAASRLASWKPLQFFNNLNLQRSRSLRSFLGPAIADLNKRQRVFIIGEKADEELTSAAVWLQERGVDIVFVEATLGVEPRSGTEYLSCRAFRARDAQAKPERPSGSPAAPPPDWSEVAADEDLFQPEPPAKPERPTPESPASQPQSPEAPDRRSVTRESVVIDRVVEVEYSGRRLGAHLTDYSEVGVALEMNSPLPIGSTVTVIGQVDAADGPMTLHRTGRVRYCRFEDQGFRLGVAFEQHPA